MYKHILTIALSALSVCASYAQSTWTGNPFASKGTIVAPVLSSSLVDEIVIVSDNPGDWKFTASLENDGGKEIISISMDAQTEAPPAKFNVYFTFPQKGVFNFWSPDVYCGTHLDPFWGLTNAGSSLAYRMPLYEYFDDNNTNCLTIACSEVLRKVDAVLGIMEEGCAICSELRFFRESEAPAKHYETKILLDKRPVFWSESIREASDWMSRVNGYESFPVNESAFEPLYSSWYQFHQDVNAEAIEQECRIAADLGMKYLVWYSVPYVGWHSDAYKKFEGKYLYNDRVSSCGVLDPRFPEVRKHLVDLYVNALKDWNLDGFKLDFIDSFRFHGEDPAVKEKYAGRDIMNLSEAVNVLMKEVSSALRAIKPEVLIEFRQQYIGPAIRQYGNMFRAADCPGNAKDNRMRIASLRLTSGSTAVHSDMLEWNISETPENVGRAIINSIFGVVQYSTMLRNIPQEQLDVMRKWMKFASDHRETLLKSEFRPHHPELGYPVIEAESDKELIIAVYQDNAVIDVPRRGKSVYILNASGSDSIVVRCGKKTKTVKVPCGDWKSLN